MKTDRIREICREIYQKHGLGDVSVQAVLFAINEEENKQELLTDLVKEGVVNYLYDAQCYVRAVICNTKSDKKSIKTFTPEFQNAVVVGVGKFFSYPLMSGITLGKATRKDILADIERRSNMVKGHSRHIRFQQMVLDGLKEGQTVSDAYTETQLELLMKQASET